MANQVAGSTEKSNSGKVPVLMEIILHVDGEINKLKTKIRCNNSRVQNLKMISSINTTITEPHGLLIHETTDF